MRAVLRRALRVPDQEPEPTPVSGPPDPPASQKGRILLVEDHRINQKIVVSILSSVGYEVEVATTGVEALEALARNTFGAVIMDCHMPEMDGFEATARLRSREDPNHRTPIIALTANTMQGDREKCLAAGMDDFLGKPFRRDVMLATLAKWM
jgi:CheY-like chemotaxis protein